MTADEARVRVAAARIARLASVDPTGRPHIVPICFAVADDEVVSVVDHKRKATARLRRLENVRANPDVQLLVDHYDDEWSALWWVRVSGRARVVEHGTECEQAIDRLAEKYPQYRDHRPEGPVLVIDVTGISHWAAVG